MGRLVVVIFMGVFGSFVSCKIDVEDDERCDYAIKTTHIKDERAHWFEALKGNATLTSLSNKGRSESFDIAYTSYYDVDYSLTDNESCIRYNCENRIVNYKSSVYGKAFECKIARSNDDILTITVPFKPGICKLNIANPSHCLVEYRHTLNFPNEWRADSFAIDVIDTLLLNNQVFYRVYKVDFQEKYVSIDGLTKVMYINPQFGIICYEGFDGEIWNIH